MDEYSKLWGSFADLPLRVLVVWMEKYSEVVDLGYELGLQVVIIHEEKELERFSWDLLVTDKECNGPRVILFTNIESVKEQIFSMGKRSLSSMIGDELVLPSIEKYIRPYSGALLIIGAPGVGKTYLARKIKGRRSSIVRGEYYEGEKDVLIKNGELIPSEINIANNVVVTSCTEIPFKGEKIYLAPLCERKEDIVLLLKYFARIFHLELTQSVFNILKNYSWPNNVSELVNCLERLSIQSRRPKKEDLPLAMLNNKSWRFELPESGIALKEIMKDIENDLIMQALEKSRGNKMAAARLLHMNRTTLIEKIKNFCQGPDQAKLS